MAYSTASPEDEYDVLIDGDLDNNEVEPPCDKYDAEVLSAQQVLWLCSTVFAVGLLANFFLAFILIKHKGLKHTRDIYFLNLALSNLCFLLPLPFWAHTASQGGSPGHPTCKILMGLHSAGLYGEALFNVLLTVQTHRAFSRVSWLSSALETVRGSIVISVLTWVVAVLVTSPEFMFYKPQMEGQKYKCSFSSPYFLTAEETFWKHFLTLKMSIFILIFPLFVFIFCYVRMRKTRSWEDRQSGLSELILAIVVVFLLMWAPYNIALFLAAFQEHSSLNDCQSSYKLPLSVQVTKIIATTHCCVNPLLYLLFDKTFRKYLCSPFPWCKKTPLRFREDSAQGPSREEHDQSSTL